MVALDAGQSEIASMLYSRMNIKCSVSVNTGRAVGSGGHSGRGRTVRKGWCRLGPMFIEPSSCPREEMRHGELRVCSSI